MLAPRFAARFHTASVVNGHRNDGQFTARSGQFGSPPKFPVSGQSNYRLAPHRARVWLCPSKHRLLVGV
jgi:hypothetical protein